jgi:uncharacterized protein (TIGR02246 family)
MSNKIWFSITAFLLLSILSISCRQSENEQNKTNTEEITSVLKQTVEAFNSEDTESFLSFFSDDVIRMQPDTWSDITKDDIRKWYENVKDKFTYQCKISIDEIIVTGDWAIVRNTCKGKLIPKRGGDPVPGFGGSRHVTILKKQLDGSWKIARDMWNNPPANNP